MTKSPLPEDRIPVIVGVGEIVDRPKELTQGLEPLTLLEEALKRLAEQKQLSEALQKLAQQMQRGEFREDPDIGGNRADTSLARMGGLLELYGQTAGGERLSKLRDVLTFTGAGDNPEVLRFVNYVASRLVETSRPVAAVGPEARVHCE